MKKIAAYVLMMICILLLAGCSTDQNINQDPFGHLYCIGDILYEDHSYSEDLNTTLIQLNEYHSLYICSDTQTYDYAMIGKFKAAEENGDSSKRTWMLFADEAQTEQYRLQWETDGTVTLSFSKYGDLQWEYQLRRVDVIDCNVMTSGSMTTIYPDWLYPDTISATLDNLTYLSGADITGTGTVELAVQDGTITSLTVYEAYYTDGNVEYSEYILDGDYTLDVSTRYESGAQLAIYRIPWGELECWFYLNFD